METDKKPGHTDVEIDIERDGQTERIDVETDGTVEVVVKNDEVDVISENADGERAVVVIHEGHPQHEHGHGHEHGEGHPHHDHGHGGHHIPPPVLVELIFVNENEVKIHAIEQTGLQIKQAAINQDVKIELDFVLAEEISDDKRRIVGNDEVVKLHEGMKFSAVRDDDNS